MRPSLLNPEQAAKVLQMDRGTLIVWARLGYVPAHPLGEGKRKSWRFLERELLDWVEAQESETESKPAGEYHRGSHRRSCKENCMSRFQQGSLLKLKRKNGPLWVFRWYDEPSGNAHTRNATSAR